MTANGNQSRRLATLRDTLLPKLLSGDQCRVAPSLIPAFSHGEKENREAIRRLNPAIPEEASACAIHADRRATIWRYFQVRSERRLNP